MIINYLFNITKNKHFRTKIKVKGTVTKKNLNILDLIVGFFVVLF